MSNFIWYRDTEEFEGEYELTLVNKSHTKILLMGFLSEGLSISGCNLNDHESRVEFLEGVIKLTDEEIKEQNLEIYTKNLLIL